METKFIGLEGFNEIESLPTKKRRVCRRELTTAQKTVRFVKRATTFCAKSVVRMSKNTAAKLAQAIENRKGSLKSVTIKAVNSSKKAKTQISAIDKAFNESRNGTTKSAGEIVSELSFKSGKQYAHLAPSAIRSQKLLRKKAVLAVVACFSAITLSCVTVASALDMKDNNSVQTPGHLLQQVTRLFLILKLTANRHRQTSRQFHRHAQVFILTASSSVRQKKLISSMQTSIRFLLITAEITMTKQQPSLQIRWRL